MQLLERTLSRAAENLALDEALLHEAEAAGRPSEVLRLWEPDDIAVVVGRGSEVAVEVNRAACRDAGVPVLRRTSGGLAVVTGPGCLMVGLILSYELRPQLSSIDAAHRLILERLARSLARQVQGVAHRGASDLAMGERKFSGNSMRCGRTHLLYHGTLLYDFDLSLISTYLWAPPRAPDYRAGREHGAFVSNLPLDRPAVRQAVLGAWPVTGTRDSYPADRVARLVAEKYSLASWNEQR